MWISSFVVTLPKESEPANRIQSAIEAIPVLQLGQRCGNRLPVVLEVANGVEARYWYEWVNGLPDVVKVDLAFVSFEEGESVESGQQQEGHVESSICSSIIQASVISSQI
jgi:nitrate reductase NapAB chaperone NapD